VLFATKNSLVGKVQQRQRFRVCSFARQLHKLHTDFDRQLCCRPYI